MSKLQGKFIFMLSIITISLVTLIGCNNDVTSQPEESDPSANGNDETITLRFAGQHPIDHMGTEAIENIKNIVEEKTDGRIEIQTFPAGQLGDYTQTYEEVMRGTIDMALISVTGHYNSLFELQWLPYLGKDPDEISRAFAPDSYLFDVIHGYHKDLGVEMLGFFGEGFIGIGSTVLPESPADFNEQKDLLIRVADFEVRCLSI